MRTSKQKSKIISLALGLLALGGVLYLLADRFLIEHVLISNVSAAYTETAALQLGTAALPENAALAATTSEASEAVADDWNYRSDTVSIAIEKVTTGSGRDAVTYFVADVILSDATALGSAFAKDSFGLNIIENTSKIAQDHGAVFAVNGDYYGFREDGIVIRNGVIYRDIPVRTGLAYYRDGTIKIYDETQTSAQELLDAGVWNTLSFGPALIEDGEVYDAAGKVKIDNNVGNHSIQGNNPRTGVGMVDANHLVFVVVDGRSAGYSRGVSLTEFARIFKDRGCTQAYNIDGGGSSTMYFMGRVVNNPLGRNRERGTSDILYVGS